MIGHYWSWVGGNIGAMPLEFLITAVVGLVFRKPIASAIGWVRRERDEALREAREDAMKARAIAADLFEHITGEAHEHSPRPRG